MARHVAVEDPVPAACRGPRHRHRLAGIHELGHREATVRSGDRAVAHSVATRVDAIVEAVQVQRMLQRADVDEAPVYGVALHHIEALGVGPREPVERQLQVRADTAHRRHIGELGPVGDEKDPVGWRARAHVRKEHVPRVPRVEPRGVHAEREVQRQPAAVGRQRTQLPIGRPLDVQVIPARRVVLSHLSVR